MSDNKAFSAWNDCAFLTRFTAFVDQLCDPASPDYTPEHARIACFDNDGTLWCEQPVPVQALFAAERLAELAKNDPHLRETAPFRQVVRHGWRALAHMQKDEILRLLSRANALGDVESFPDIVREWFKTATHPVLNRPISETVYAPMRELVRYLQTRGFTVFLVSAGSQEFMRGISHQFYNIAPQHVIGTTLKLSLERDGACYTVKRSAEINHFDDHEMKIRSIVQYIGQSPQIILGNSDGDIEMMQYLHKRGSPSLCALLHHDDNAREFDYEHSEVPSGALTSGKHVAEKNGWPLISMKNDFKTVFVSKPQPA